MTLFNIDRMCRGQTYVSTEKSLYFLSGLEKFPGVARKFVRIFYSSRPLLVKHGKDCWEFDKEQSEIRSIDMQEVLCTLVQGFP